MIDLDDTVSKYESIIGLSLVHDILGQRMVGTDDKEHDEPENIGCDDVVHRFLGHLVCPWLVQPSCQKLAHLYRFLIYI